MSGLGNKLDLREQKKVILSPSTLQSHVGGTKFYYQKFLSSELDGGQWPNSLSGCCALGKGSRDILNRRLRRSDRESGHF